MGDPTSPGSGVPEPAVTLRHAGGDCPVHVGPGLLRHLGDLLRHYLPDRQAIVISDANVATAVPVPGTLPSLSFPAGERSKTRETWAHLTDQLLALGVGRDGAIVAVGGGVTGDLAGFVAATYLRGIPVLQVPTSLLAMVDASIGGKTGVDTATGKNLVGAFHQPVAVLIDPLVLRSLPIPHLRNGLAEVVKHAAIVDDVHFGWLGTAAAGILERDPPAMEAMVRRSVAIKTQVVESDERERGRRAILNAGHTVAHALEQVSAFRVPHGEAVAIGLVTEAALGEGLGITAAGTAGQLADLLRRFGLPTAVPAALSTDQLLAVMRLDKKNRRGEVRVALLARIGAMHGDDATGWTAAVPEAAMRSALEATRG